jgi:hypothetical protein
MKDWYQPDEIWRHFGIKTREEYVQRHVFDAPFHAGVPEDIVRAYGTAGQLMAQAWHHYPLYDEAVAKLLFIVEMAVKLRCAQVGIGLFASVSAGRTRAKPLQRLIEELAQLEPHKAQQFQHPLHHARGLRNYFAHPGHYSHAGVMLRHHVQPLVNLLNLLFVEEATVLRATTYLSQLQQAEVFRAELVGLAWKAQHIILSRAIPLQAHWVNDEWRVIWAFYPLIPNIFDVVSRHQLAAPILLAVTGLDTRGSVMVGKDVASATPLALEPAPAGLSQLLLSRHYADYQRASEEDRRVFVFGQQTETARLEAEMVYAHFWQP